MSSRNLLAVAMLALAMLAGGGAMVVHAIPGHTAGGDGAIGDNVAVVDMERLYNGSDLPLVLAQTAAKLEQQSQDRLDQIEAARFLDLKEMQEYVELIGKAQPDGVQLARIKTLKAQSDQRSAELDTLNVKKDADLTPADRTKKRALVEMSHTTDKVLPTIQNDYAQDQNERLRAVRRDQLAQLRTIVGQVAKPKGYVHVFDTSALVYSANDITPLVMQKLKPPK